MWSLVEVFHGEREKCFLGGSLENGHLMEGVFPLEKVNVPKLRHEAAYAQNKRWSKRLCENGFRFRWPERSHS